MKKVGLACLAFVLLATGCSVSQEEAKDTTKDLEVVSQVKEKKTKEFDKNSKQIKQDETITMGIEFDPKEKKMTNMTEVFEIYQDANLKQPVATQYEYDKEKNKISLKPPRIPVGSIGTLDVDKKDHGYTDDTLMFYDKPNTQWGRMNQLYLVTKVDVKTGEKLPEPLVQVLNVDQKIEEEMKLSLELSKEGQPIFHWNKVKEAEYYYVISYDYKDDKGITFQGFVGDKTTDTKWQPENLNAFKTFKVSELERGTEENIKKYGKGNEPIKQETDSDTVYAVVGVNADGTTAMSNMVKLSNISERIPLYEEVKKSFDEEGNTTITDMSLLPSFRWITMADGTLVQRLINYDLSKAKETEEVWGEYEKEDLSDLKSKRVKIISIPYTVDGTKFKGVAKVSKYNKDNWQAHLKQIDERQNKLKSKAGMINFEIAQKDVEIDKGKLKESSKKATEKVKDQVTAHTKLSEYLAQQMLTRQEWIDISDYSETTSSDVLMDNFEEAMYQNPLILGVKNIALSKNGHMLIVSYEDNQKEFEKKQESIRKEVKEVAKKIVKDDMSDLQKEFAINQYLIETAKYDDAALENAEKNQFKNVDKEFNDSFTPYGVLVNKVGVCASYAGAFKLLADEVGLESIVVTGYLDGEVPHAWNKVKLDNAWHSVDSTNNDNELILNALLNAPKKATKKILQEDERYLVDDYLKDYEASDDDKDKEYYHVEKKFFDQKEVAQKLIEGLKKEESITLRTDYQIDDDDFMSIVKAVNAELRNEDLKGTYWNGVIFLSNK
ncbi:transglutaminase domain-containing protein [Vagococcus hydrophili]